MEQNIIDVSDKLPLFENGVIMGKTIDRLAEFEDFMEEQGFESVEQLKEIIEIFKTSRRLCFGISARRNGKSLMLMNELIDLCKYKNKWQKLKEWVKEQSNPIDNLVVSNDETKYIYMSDILDEMEELEKE